MIDKLTNSDDESLKEWFVLVEAFHVVGQLLSNVTTAIIHASITASFFFIFLLKLSKINTDPNKESKNNQEDDDTNRGK